MKRKEVTAVFEWTNEHTLIEQIERLKAKLLEGKEYSEKVHSVCGTELLLQFMQKYEKTRSFKVVNSNEIIIRSKV